MSGGFLKTEDAKQFTLYEINMLKFMGELIAQQMETNDLLKTLLTLDDDKKTT